MPYTANNPPIVKSNLGTEPWSDIGTVLPNIHITDSDGVAVTLDVLNNKEMTQVTGSPIWTYKVADHMTVVNAFAEFLYTITRGPTGEIVDEGSFIVESSDNIVSTLGDIEIQYPPALEIPASAGTPKIFKISATPKSLSGAIIQQDSASITINFADAGNTDITGAAMSDNGNGVWEYNWSVANSLVEDIATIDITVTKNAVNTNASSKNVQLFKRHEFNPQRIASGLVR